MNLMKNMQKKSRLHLLLLALCYFVALLVFSCYTSPLYPNYFGYDSAIFSLMGKGILAGKALYSDLFDHKGPIIFLINALGFWLGGRSGIFWVQYIFGVVSIVFLFHAGSLLRQKKCFSSFGESLCIFFAVFSYFFYAFQRGNLTEEYSMPFISASLYLFVKYAAEAENHTAHPPLYSLFHGINFACLAFLRLNNAVSIAMGVLAIIAYLIYKRHYANLVINILTGCAGLLIITVPILFYFFCNGSLEEMLYATFLHNFKIAENIGHIPLSQEPIKFVALYFPLLFCVALVTLKVRNNRHFAFMDVLLAVILGGNVVVLWIANRFPHYFAVFTPVYAVFLSHYLYVHKERMGLVCVTACTMINLAFAAYFSVASFNDVYIEKDAALRHDIIQEAVTCIPEDERNSIIGYCVAASDYLSANIMPCYKYYTLQDTWSVTNPQIMDDFMAWLLVEKPKWVLINSNEENEAVLDILENGYELRSSNDYLAYYRIKDSVN